MKMIKKILIVSLSGFFCACGNDWLDTKPATSVDSETAINNISDLAYTINGIYSAMQAYEYYGARMQYYGDVTGDDVQAYGTTKRCADYYQFAFNKDNAPYTFWSTCFFIMTNANLILADIDKIKIDENNAKEVANRNNIKGQALALRALALFDLTRLYGYPYLKDNGASWGGVVIKTTVDKDYKPKRNTVAECYEAFLEDLEDALPLLTEDRTNGKINKWGAMTLLSRAYLYKGDNENALRVAKEAIAGAKKKGFQLWSNEEYKAVWAKDFTSEVFFEVVNLLTDGPGKESIGNLWYESGYYDMILTCSFEKFMKEDDPKDVRYNLINYSTKRKRYVCMKYPGQAGEAPADANVPVFRMSELYLNAAEAAVKLGSAYKDDAETYLEAIVKRANPDKTVAGTTITLEQVLKERRKEFFGEGHRMFDLLRNNLRVTRSNVSGGAYKHLALLDYATDFDWTMYKVVLAVPKKEMDANSNMAGQQNPGY